ncbi:MAG: cytochrome-c peroxidase [Pseudomonadota bacterium]
MKRKITLAAALAAAFTAPALIGTAGAAKTEAEALSPKAQLGRVLFFDSGLSEPAGQSCASCHDPGRAFVDPDKNAATSKGVIPPLIGSRNTPTSMYMAFSPRFHWDEEEELYLGGQFWDGRAATLEEQAKGPFVNPLEMANPHPKDVVEKVRRAAYAPMFEQVFGKDALQDDDEAYDRIAEALAEFQRTREFAPFTSKYDAYLAGKTRLSKQEMRGLRLFEAEDKGNCAACHPSRPGPKGEPPLFTDFSYDNLGVPRNPDNPFYRLPAKYNPAGELFVDRGLGGALNKPSEDGKFKVPTLRNIAITGPYMHNGYFKTLEGVVAFYNDRDVRPQCDSNRVREAEALEQKCWPAPEVISNVNKDELGDLGLTPREIADIVAFMKTLTDGWQAGK